MTDEEADVLRPEETPVGLNFIVLAGTYMPVRSVYLATRGLGNDVFLATEESAQADRPRRLIRAAPLRR